MEYMRLTILSARYGDYGYRWLSETSLLQSQNSSSSQCGRCSSQLEKFEDNCGAFLVLVDRKSITMGGKSASRMDPMWRPFRTSRGPISKSTWLASCCTAFLLETCSVAGLSR